MKRLMIILFAGCTTLPVVSAQDSLNYYLETAARNNPSVMAAFHDYEVALQKIPQAGAYEDPRLDAGFFLKPMDIIDGRQIAQIQLMQMFPWFGTKKAARTETQHMAKMSFEQFRETRDNLFLDVYRQWYVLNRLQQRLKNNRENIELLKQLETLALRRFSSEGAVSEAAVSGGSYSLSDNAAGAILDKTGNLSTGGNMSGMNTGKSREAQSQSTANVMSSMNGNPGSMAMSSSSGGLSGILRIQLELAELENSSESIRSEINAEKARFNALLNCSAENEVAVPDTFALTPYLLDIDIAMQMIAAQNPSLGMIREESAAYGAKEEMSRKMGYPMFGIGLQYMLIGNRSEANTAAGMTDMEMAANNTMNGKDMFMPMLSVSIPIYRNKYKAARKEAQFQQQAAQARYDEALNNMEAALYRFRHELNDAERKIRLYRKQAALARTTYDLLVQEFASGKSDLSSIIQVQRQLSDYRLKESEAIADYNTMVATIQKMISSKDIEQ
jgi:outer membrane protein TolC